MPVIVVTAFGTIDTAVEAMRAGAYDFVTKPFDVDAVALCLHRAADHSALRREVADLRRAVDASHRFGPLLGTSEVMRELCDLVDRVANSLASVLVTGESGTGKELVARELHRRSDRHEGPFVALNCAAMPESLLESELFGHVRGAFTDAKTSRDGLLVQASGGTVFLDEIGDMPVGLQPKLLRALQEKRVRPLGSAGERAFDARVIAATHRDLEAAIEEKTFREDLYYRLNVVEIGVPTLRTRGGDILLLARSFLSDFAAQNRKRIHDLNEAAAERLLAYDWPGNVRELRNCIWSAASPWPGPGAWAWKSCRRECAITNRRPSWSRATTQPRCHPWREWSAGTSRKYLARAGATRASQPKCSESAARRYAATSRRDEPRRVQRAARREESERSCAIPYRRVFGCAPKA